MTSSTPGQAKPPLWERPWVLWVSSAVLLAVIAAFVYGFVVGGRTQPSAQVSQELPTGMNQATASLLSLSPTPTDPVTAPAYRLHDQNGALVDSSSLRGRVVVLVFNDDRCTDLCVMLSSDIIAADHDLSARARAHVAFVAINANPYYPSTTDVKAWSDAHGLNALPNWRYLTGTPTQLAALARAYDVPIQLDPRTRTIGHGTQIFVIDPSGRESLLAAFGAEAADTAPFAHGLATMANDTLPADQRGPVAGTNLAAAVPGGTGIGDTPKPVTGTMLSGGTLSTAQDRGRFTVLDFWSSTCTACAIQLPDDQAEATRLGRTVGFVGVDVDDTAAAGQATLSRYGVHIQTVRDGSGAQAARFRISELPYTVILSPSGSVLVRHPGLFTTDELDFELHSLDPGLAGPAQ